MDLGDDELDAAPASNPEKDEFESGTSGSFFVAPQAGTSVKEYWRNNSSVAADHSASGSVESAMNLLNRQVGISNFEPLKASFLSIYRGSTCAVPGIPGVNSIPSYLMRNADTSAPGKEALPRTTIKLDTLSSRLKTAYRAFTAGKFAECKSHFLYILTHIPLCVAETKDDVSNLKELLGICREYVNAIRIKDALSEPSNDNVRVTELGAYFTHCNLEIAHLMLALDLAMTKSFKNKNYITAASFARRLLELPDVSSEKVHAMFLKYICCDLIRYRLFFLPKLLSHFLFRPIFLFTYQHAKLRAKAQKVVKQSEKEGRNADTLNYDERKPFVLCAKMLTPIYRDTAQIKCSYCGSSFLPEFMGILCSTCNLATVRNIAKSQIKLECFIPILCSCALIFIMHQTTHTFYLA